MLNFFLLIGLIAIGIFVAAENFLQHSSTKYSYPTIPQVPQQENMTNIIQIDTSCNTNLDCSWQITNCCSANAGGYWQCINPQKSVIKCNALNLCPQYVSPKPEAKCVCISNKCEVE